MERRQSIRTVTALTVAVAGIAAASAGASPLPQGGICGPASAPTLAAGAAGRVYAVGHNVYACANHNGHRTLLGTDTTCNTRTLVGPFAIAGGLVAYGAENCGVDTGSSQLLEVQLTNGQQAGGASAMPAGLGAESYTRVDSLVLRPDGSLAWIQTGSSLTRHRSQIYVYAAHIKRTSPSTAMLSVGTLDHGSAIVTNSLALHGPTVTWRHGASTRSATLN
jgi:hypothetical protein